MKKLLFPDIFNSKYIGFFFTINMNKKHAEKLLQINNNTYNKIALEFSQTRNYKWREFNDFKKYVKNGNKILDIGCGNGRLIEMLKEFDISYIGIDQSKNLLQQAKLKYPKYKFSQGDILDKDFAENTFDIIFSIAVLNHIPSSKLRLKALKNINKTLKPGGILILSNWNLWTFKSKKNLYKHAYKKFKMSKKEWYDLYGIEKNQLSYRDILTIWKSNEKTGVLYYYAFSKRTIKKLLKKAEFKVEKVYYSNKKWYKFGNLITIAKKK